jgi:DNA modification methylase
LSVRILRGDALAMLKTLPDESVHCCVTSPPYYGLRCYGIEGQYGLEPTLAEYLDNMVAVFREARRVLRSDGTLWLNIGDSYNAYNGGAGPGSKLSQRQSAARPALTTGYSLQNKDLKPKDLMLVPHRLALALQDDGWWVRSEIIWHKLSAMPESVTDRPTKAHEHIWLLSKSERYYYDAAAASEPVTQDERRPTFRGGAYCNDSTFDNSEGGKTTDTGNVRVKVPSGWDTKAGAHGTVHREGRTQEPEYTKRSGNKERKPASARGVPVDTDGSTNGAVAGSIPWEGSTRNWRDVWSLGPEPFKEAHFATFPTEIPRRAIVAGCPIGGTVLDPFGGAGTTGLVADRLQRSAILIELNPEYAAMAERRIRSDSPLFAEVA